MTKTAGAGPLAEAKKKAVDPSGFVMQNQALQKPLNSIECDINGRCSIDNLTR